MCELSCARPAAAKNSARFTRIITRRRVCLGCPERGDRIFAASWSWIWARSCPSVAGPKRPQDRIELAKLKKRVYHDFSKPVTENGFGKSGDGLEQGVFVTRPAAAEPTAGGGKSGTGFQQAAETARTRIALDRVGNGEQPAYAGRWWKRPRHGGEGETSAWERADRCDHELHEHEQSLRDAGGGIAGEESGGKRAAGRIRRSRLRWPRARGSSLIIWKRPDCNPIWISLDLTWSAMAARLASAIPARCSRRLKRRSRRTIWWPRRVLSGNRNFEARVHQSIKANFLMCPPLVVAFALAGRVNIDLTKEPIGQRQGRQGRLSARYLADPAGSARSDASRAEAGSFPTTLSGFRGTESHVERNSVQRRAMCMNGTRKVTYIQEPPFFTNFQSAARTDCRRFNGARPLGDLWRFGDDRSHLAGGQHQENFAGR